MRVVLLSEVFAKKMGYLGNILPKYLARFGAEVHLITMDLPPYHHIKDLKETYSKFSEGAELIPGTIEKYDGFTLHVLGHRKVFGRVRMKGLWKKLAQIRPDIVQTMAAIGWLPLDAALAQPFMRYRLFTGCHMTASVFPLASQNLPWWNKDRLRCFFQRGIPGRLSSVFAEKCYAATIDCADVAVRFFGVPKNQVDVCPLGVDTELFSPISNAQQYQEKLELRQRLGFAESEIVCIYTGRFSGDKNPLLLARAVSHLVSEGEPFRGLFVGDGVQGAAIESSSGCITHPFVPVQRLGAFFRAADIGVWPTQESTSMLDAAACGLPIVVNDTLFATERVEGNGVRYKWNDLGDLIRVLKRLRDRQLREQLGSVGARKMASEFSWENIARRRMRDYKSSLGSNGALRPLIADGPLCSTSEVCTTAVKSNPTTMHSNDQRPE